MLIGDRYELVVTRTSDRAGELHQLALVRDESEVSLRYEVDGAPRPVPELDLDAALQAESCLAEVEPGPVEAPLDGEAEQGETITVDIRLGDGSRGSVASFHWRGPCPDAWAALDELQRLLRGWAEEG